MFEPTKIAEFTIKGLCCEDFVNILAANGYTTRTTIKGQENKTDMLYVSRTVEVYDREIPFGETSQHCRTNPTNDCPNCPRYKDDCDGLEQHDMFGIQDELDKLTIRPDGERG